MALRVFRAGELDIEMLAVRLPKLEDVSLSVGERGELRLEANESSSEGDDAVVQTLMDNGECLERAPSRSVEGAADAEVDE